MKPYTLGVLLLSTLFAVGLPPAARATTAPFQDDVEDLADDALDAIDQAIDERDPERMRESFETLDMVYRDVSPRTVKRIGKAVGKVFSKYQPRVEVLDYDEVTDEYEIFSDKDDVEGIYVMAVGLLYDKPEGPDVLKPLLKQAHIKEWGEVRAAIVEGLGYRADPGELSFFSGLLKDSDPAVARAAVVAIGQLKDADFAIRKKAAKVLVERYADATKRAQKELKRKREDAEAGDAERFLGAVEAAMDEALTELTRQRFTGSADWETWFDEHPDEEDW